VEQAKKPRGVEGKGIRDKAYREGVWAMEVAAHGRPRAAGRVSAPGEEGARRNRPAASGRAASDGTASKRAAD